MAKYMLSRYHQRRNAAILQLGGHCNNCNATSNLHFHHKKQPEKLFTLAKALSGWSQDRIQKELKKCILLCETCHKQHHKSKFGCGTPQRYWRGCRCDLCRNANNIYVKHYRSLRNSMAE